MKDALDTSPAALRALAEFVDTMCGLEVDQSGRFLDEVTHRYAESCAACGVGRRITKPRVFKAGEDTEPLYTSVCNHCGIDAPTAVQHTANLWLLHGHRIKELEAENLRIKSERDEAGALFTKGTMECLEAAQKVQAENERLRHLLRDLHALVWGECPSLLDEDSGGDSKLALEVDAAMKGGK